MKTCTICDKLMSPRYRRRAHPECVAKRQKKTGVGVLVIRSFAEAGLIDRVEVRDGKIYARIARRR